MTTIYDFGTAEGEMVSLDDYKKARRFSRLWKISAKAWKHAESAKSGFAEMWHGRAIELQTAVIGRDKTIEDMRAQLVARERDFIATQQVISDLANALTRAEKAEAENAALRARVAELEALSREALAALVWCSGADDFAPEGKARLGWDRVVTPVFVNGRNILTNWGKP